VIAEYPKEFHIAKDPVKYLTQIKDFVESMRKALPAETQLQNIQDEIAGLVDGTLYKLRFLS
jgi:hypothetical protein